MIELREIKRRELMEAWYNNAGKEKLPFVRKIRIWENRTTSKDKQKNDINLLRKEEKKWMK